MHSLKPTGLPPDNSRSCAIKAISSFGVVKEECAAGDTQSTPIGICRASAISGVILEAGNIPPCPGFAPWLSLISIILIWSRLAVSRNFSALKLPSSLRHPKYPEATW